MYLLEPKYQEIPPNLHTVSAATVRAIGRFSYSDSKHSVEDTHVLDFRLLAAAGYAKPSGFVKVTGALRWSGGSQGSSALSIFGTYPAIASLKAAPSLRSPPDPVICVYNGSSFSGSNLLLSLVQAGKATLKS
jgi:hypothetical protein